MSRIALNKSDQVAKILMNENEVSSWRDEQFVQSYLCKILFTCGLNSVGWDGHHAGTSRQLTVEGMTAVDTSWNSIDRWPRSQGARNQRLEMKLHWIVTAVDNLSHIAVDDVQQSKDSKRRKPATHRGTAHRRSHACSCTAKVEGKTARLDVTCIGSSWCDHCG